MLALSNIEAMASGPKAL